MMFSADLLGHDTVDDEEGEEGGGGGDELHGDAGDEAAGCCEDD